ncbi:hypothetical protein M404DRAFT_594657 [Pisolithus tinctorius Marx 270]|uniref:Uncharacterized protein n=1 Tax=Pisolithus tinctorius Marx 270 TaxID=870435 RepID=A0A0C3PI46_PISTI|nr:hypothetical protein M404DRAFT_594657 [Pisolithus tinctorius Marx 270]
MLLRSVLQPATRRLSLQRTFVSTVLLSRTWENETVVALRKEAKLRGLSTCVFSLPLSDYYSAAKSHPQEGQQAYSHRTLTRIRRNQSSPTSTKSLFAGP